MSDSPTILAIETATANCSVAVQSDGAVHEQSQTGNNVHSQVLLNMVQEVLGMASLTCSDLDAVAVGQGPGSFTGLRIGVGVAQGIAYGAGCSMIGVSSLAALAAQAHVLGQTSGTVIAAIDARMSEVYWGVFELNAEPKLIGDLQVSAPGKIDIPTLQALNVDIAEDGIILVGNAWSEYPQDFDQALLSKATQIKNCVFPLATEVLAMAVNAYSRQATISPIDFAPEYVRNNVAAKKKPNS